MREAPAAASVSVGDRIQSLDVLRGLALLGMFVVHERSTDPGGIDELVRTLVWSLVESKSHGTVALAAFGVVSSLAGHWQVERWNLGPLMLIVRDQCLRSLTQSLSAEA
jgi:uncharacterized membrane protein